MARILSIDYGQKRTGVAVTDVGQLIANGLCTLPTAGVLPFLLDYVRREAVERIVIGQPRQLDNTPSESMRYITPFVKKLREALPDMPVDFFDERFTSTLAHRAMIDGGLRQKARRNKALVDEISATILLQDYMESKKYKESV